MNYYPFHVGDYVSATRHLSWDEDAAYRRLLDVYYTTEKPLPLELRQVCRLVLATTDAQREAVQTVLTEFFEQTAEGWVNLRAEAEIVAMREKQQKQRDKANRRWDKQRTEHGNTPAMQQHTNDDATASNIDADAMPPTPTPTPTPTPKKDGESANRSPSGSRIPDGFPESDEIAWCRSERPDLDATALREKFRDYWIGVPGQKGRKADWPATWRNFVRNEFGRPQARASPPRRSAAVEAGLALAGFTRRQPETIDVDATELAAPRLG